MMRIQMRVNQRRMIVRIAVTMNVLKRRQNKGGYKSQTAGECENPPHYWQRTSARDSSPEAPGNECRHDLSGF